MEKQKKLDVILHSNSGLKFLPSIVGSDFGLSIDINSYDFKFENNKLKINYGYGLGIEDDLINLGKTLNVVVDPSNCLKFKKINYKLDGKDISSYGLFINNGQGLKINNNKLELDLNPYKGLQFYNNQLGLKANISEFIGLENNSGLRVSTETQKLSIDIDPLKAMLYNVLGNNLIYDPITKKLDVKINVQENETISILKGKMLIEDHSITYLNLQDKSGMKFDSNNKVTEIMNYRNKLFEYKHIKVSQSENDYISHFLNISNPNESYLEFTYSYLKSNIIEDYRITIFFIVKINKIINIFTLQNNDESLTILNSFLYINANDKNKIDLRLTTTDIHTSHYLNTNMLINKKNLVCISWNGVNSAVYTNGKKIYTFTHSGVGSTTSGNHIFKTHIIEKLYEFIIFNSLLLNDEKINSINKYLADKHDITLLV